ncbi:uncharacterized protein FIBRA_07328 [Fibroporia radiculosa]|uniref:CCHC-type domain-containing protein n=1 Tax=Fibroporia radiculosa TaxID=599839 RepID=J4GUQ5_9APHY|nr:uncharacterized protein FIBRA_07328 [Fibroporia radiculosa]CCM05120.1 predicted protein [Fibroporia radiculosa]
MAARVGRIARLTLYSGPHCSLCDTAKAELAKVKRQRAFELETINIQDKGQERWKRKYVYWIPALHVEGKEVAKGRWDAQTVTEALDTWEKNPWTKEDQGQSKSASFISRYPLLRVFLRCFNCGSSDHAFSSCPEPRNHALISLSRQLFTFFKDDSSCGFRRIHEVEEWKRQRLAWLEEFEPGKIRGERLREALSLCDGDSGESVEWLRNMTYWGYPNGWVGSEDPCERVWQKISGEIEDGDGLDDDEDCDLFLVSGDDGLEERLVLSSSASPPTPAVATDQEVDASETQSSSSYTRASSKEATVRRWANYPGTYFLSSLLPVYNGRSLPALDAGPSSDSGIVSSTFDADREALWNRIISQSSDVHRQHAQNSSIASSFHALNDGALPSLDLPPPPPPAATPPPLPPPSIPPPPLPPPHVPSPTSPGPHARLCLVSDSDEADMDLSD